MTVPTKAAQEKPRKPAKEPRAIKLTDDELAAQARTRIAAAHAVRRFDLTAEPWIPVLRAGEVVMVGLRGLLLDAHHITDVALPNALLRASMRRLLGALTADLVRRDRNLLVDDWETLHANNVGFRPEQVDALLTGHADHLWLWHPQTPFLQDQRLAPGLVKPHSDQPVQELLLHLPSGSSAAWWVKAQEPALLGGLPSAETALWLTARWFYAINGNCGELRLGDGSTVTSQSGGTFAETVATVTHVFRVDGLSLFRSLLRGLPTALPEVSSELSGPAAAATSCAWLDTQQPRPSADPLYLATLNASAVLLTDRDERGCTTRFVRASTPISGDIAKDLRGLAMREDKQRVTTLNDKGDLQAIRVLPTTLRGDLLQAFHRAGFDGQQLFGVINSSDCWLRADARTVDHERLDLLLVGKGGTGSSPVWEDLVGVELPARQVDPSHPNQRVVEHVRAAVQVAFDPKTGVRQRLEWAVADLLAQPAPNGWTRPKRDNTTAQALTETAVNMWLARTADAFERVLSSISPDDLDRWTTAVWTAARAAFDDIARPYTTSTRYAPRYAVALRQLAQRSQA